MKKKKIKDEKEKNEQGYVLLGIYLLFGLLRYFLYTDTYGGGGYVHDFPSLSLYPMSCEFYANNSITHKDSDIPITCDVCENLDNDEDEGLNYKEVILVFFSQIE